MKKKFLATGFGLLAISSYLDSVRGPLLPHLSSSFGVSYDLASLFLSLGNIAAIPCTLLLIPLLRRWGEKIVCIAVAYFLLLSCFFAYRIHTFGALQVFALLLGAGIGMGGALCNVMVILGASTQNRARMVSLLHAGYGFFSLVAPPIAVFIFSLGYPWANCVGWLAAPIGLFLIFMHGLPRDGTQNENRPEKSDISFIHFLIPIVFALYVAAEVTTSMWMVTYLVESRSIDLNKSAFISSGFFLVMGLSRIVCSYYIREKWEWVWIWCSALLSMSFFGLGRVGFDLAYSFTGVIGPFFPILLSRVSHAFPNEWRSLTLWVLASVQCTLALSHFLMGWLSSRIGIRASYDLPFILMLLALLVLGIYVRMERMR